MHRKKKKIAGKVSNIGFLSRKSSSALLTCIKCTGCVSRSDGFAIT